MRTRPLLLALGLVILTLSMGALAAEAVGWGHSCSLSRGPLHQGENVTVDVTFRNINDYDVKLEFLAIQFDWQSDDQFHTFHSRESEKLLIHAGGSVDLRTRFFVDGDLITIGVHRYTLFTEFLFWDDTYYTWWPISFNSSDRIEVRGPDRDGDGVADLDDEYPDDPTEWADSDMDGYPDNSDAFPQDPSEWVDSDGDNRGDNSDDFPNDRSEWYDADRDGVGGNSDVFPEDPSEWADSDDDGHGDNMDVFPEDPSEWADGDDDGHGDNSDAYPDDPRRWEEGDVLSLGSANMSLFAIVGMVALSAILGVVVAKRMWRPRPPRSTRRGMKPR